VEVGYAILTSSHRALSGAAEAFLKAAQQSLGRQRRPRRGGQRRTRGGGSGGGSAEAAL
jgi:hypothetical protein